MKFYFWISVLIIAFDIPKIKSEFNQRTGYACEGDTLKIECPQGHVIRILRANYGRLQMAMCSEDRETIRWQLTCMSPKSLKVVSEQCADHRWCQVPASSYYFGDPCPNTFKYLEIEFSCLTDPFSESLVSPVTFNDSISEDIDLSNFSFTDRRPTSRPTFPDFNSPDYEGPDACPAIYMRGVQWPRAKPGDVIYKKCPNNPDSDHLPWWQCGYAGIGWIGRPDMSRCASSNIIRTEKMLHQPANKSSKHLNMIANDLMDLTAPIEEEFFFGGDLDIALQTMQATVDEVEVVLHSLGGEEQDAGIVSEINKAVVKTVDNLLDERHTDAWLDLPQATQAESATRIISTIEKSAHQLAKTLRQPTTILNVSMNIALQINVIDTSSDVNDVTFPTNNWNNEVTKGTNFEGFGSSLTLTGETIKQLGEEGLAKVLFTLYSNIEQWLQPQQQDSEWGEPVKIDEDSFESGKFKYNKNRKNQHNDGASEKKKEEGSEGREPPTKNPHKNLGDKKIINEEFSKEKNMALNSNKTIVNSKIISASVNRGGHGNRQLHQPVPLKEPVVYTLEHLALNDAYEPTCSFWEYSEKTMSGQWSTFGCVLMSTNRTHTTCACQHLTNFAVLVSIVDQSASVSHTFALSLITYCGCLVSVVALLLAFLTFVLLKSLHCDRNTIHINLALCLATAEIIFLLGITPNENKLLCSIIAIFLHYFFLAAFFWMLLEGLQLYIMLVEVFETEKSRIVYFYLFSYGVPAIVVSISAAINFPGYGTDKYCWLSTENGFIWAFAGPVAVIIVLNIIMLSIATQIMCSHRNSAANWKVKPQSNLHFISTWLKGSFILIVLLGLTWIFGFFYVSDSTLIMAYLFTIFNSLQGLFIFLFHCLLNEKVWKEYKRFFRHGNFVSNFLRCGGTKGTSYTSTSRSSTSPINKKQRFSIENISKLIFKRKKKKVPTATLR